MLNRDVGSLREPLLVVLLVMEVTLPALERPLLTPNFKYNQEWISPPLIFYENDGWLGNFQIFNLSVIQHLKNMFYTYAFELPTAQIIHSSSGQGQQQDINYVYFAVIQKIEPINKDLS